LAFAARAENIILLGPPGVGKTHLAVGISIVSGHVKIPQGVCGQNLGL